MMIKVTMRQGGCLLIMLIVTVAARCGDVTRSDASYPSGAARTEVDTTSYVTSRLDLAVPDTVHGEVFFSGEELGEPARLILQGSYLVVGDFSMRPPLHVLDAETGRYLGSAGRKGEGPGEFGNVWILVRGASNGTGVGVYDGALRRMTHLDLQPLAQGQAPRLGEVVLDQLPFTMFSMDRVNDTLLVASGFQPEGRLALLKPDLGLLRYIGPDPPGDDQVPVPVRQHAYQRWVRYHPVWDLVLVAYYYADLVEAYRLDGTQVWATRGPQGFDPIYDVLPYQGQPARATRPDTRYAYKSLDIFGKGDVLGLYVGREARDQEYQLAHEVHLFNRQGQLYTRFALSPPVYAGVAARSDGCFFAVAVLPEPAVMRYCLPDDAGGR